MNKVNIKLKEKIIKYNFFILVLYKKFSPHFYKMGVYSPN